MAERIRQINPECIIHPIREYFTKENAEEILSPSFDYVVDAIDGMMTKSFLIAKCKRSKTPHHSQWRCRWSQQSSHD